MIGIFADTYFWLALINPRDQAHQEALSLSQSLSEPLFTTAWVLTEVGDAMHDPINRPAFIGLMQDIANDPQTSVIPAEQKWFERGFALFAKRLDKKWSLTDCISFVVMQDRGLTDALTGDGDFVQAGFRKLMA
ncbi:MAG: type II toxin-antitoxin system VapC family toxin [Gemmataceae bacterium]